VLLVVERQAASRRRRLNRAAFGTAGAGDGLSDETRCRASVATQFAFTVTFHIIFPSMSIGLAAFLVLTEALYLRHPRRLYVRVYSFGGHLRMGFGMGVVSGIVMSFEFGTNSAAFARAAGSVIGPVIGLEVLTAFFLEAGFLGIMLFGWERVGSKLHFLATCLVSLGTTISAACIMVVNSWMQTPAGVRWESGSLVVDSWWHVVMNRRTVQFLHMLMAALDHGLVSRRGVAAYYLLRGRHTGFARRASRWVSGGEPPAAAPVIPGRRSGRGRDGAAPAGESAGDGGLLGDHALGAL